MAGEPIRIGGLMRCCIQTIREHDQPGMEGVTLACRHDTGNRPATIRFRAGAWEWIPTSERRPTDGQ
jgi:hypothetical protein